jgi:hypothetical protein
MPRELDRLQDLVPSLPVDADVQLRKCGYGGALSWKRLATIKSYRDRNGNTRLMRAVRSSDFNQAAALLTLCQDITDITVRNNAGETAIDAAIEQRTSVRNSTNETSDPLVQKWDDFLAAMVSTHVRLNDPDVVSHVARTLMREKRKRKLIAAKMFEERERERVAALEKKAGTLDGALQTFKSTLQSVTLPCDRAALDDEIDSASAQLDGALRSDDTDDALNAISERIRYAAIAFADERREANWLEWEEHERQKANEILEAPERAAALDKIQAREALRHWTVAELTLAVQLGDLTVARSSSRAEQGPAIAADADGGGGSTAAGEAGKCASSPEDPEVASREALFEDMRGSIAGRDGWWTVDIVRSTSCETSSAAHNHDEFVRAATKAINQKQLSGAQLVENGTTASVKSLCLNNDSHSSRLETLIELKLLASVEAQNVFKKQVKERGMMQALAACRCDLDAFDASLSHSSSDSKTLGTVISDVVSVLEEASEYGLGETVDYKALNHRIREALDEVRPSTDPRGPGLMPNINNFAHHRRWSRRLCRMLLQRGASSSS